MSPCTNAFCAVVVARAGLHGSPDCSEEKNVTDRRQDPSHSTPRSAGTHEEEWTRNDVVMRLIFSGLESVEHSFIDHGVDGRVLINMNVASFGDLGMNTLMDNVQLRDKIRSGEIKAAARREDTFRTTE